MDQIVLQIALNKIKELSYQEASRLEQILRMKGSKEIQIGFTVSMEPDQQNNILDFRLGVVYYTVIESVRHQLVEYKALFTFEILGLEEHLQAAELERIAIKPELFSLLLGIAVGSVRGMLAVKMSGSLLDNYPLPIINLTSLMQALHQSSMQERSILPAFGYKIV